MLGMPSARVLDRRARHAFARGAHQQALGCHGWHARARGSLREEPAAALDKILLNTLLSGTSRAALAALVLQAFISKFSTVTLGTFVLKRALARHALRRALVCHARFALAQGTLTRGDDALSWRHASLPRALEIPVIAFGALLRMGLPEESLTAALGILLFVELYNGSSSIVRGVSSLEALFSRFSVVTQENVAQGALSHALSRRARAALQGVSGGCARLVSFRGAL